MTPPANEALAVQLERMAAECESTMDAETEEIATFVPRVCSGFFHDYLTDAAAKLRKADRLLEDSSRQLIEERVKLVTLEERLEAVTKAADGLADQVDQTLESHPKAMSYPDGPCIEKDQRKDLVDALTAYNEVRNGAQRSDDKEARDGK